MQTVAPRTATSASSITAGRIQFDCASVMIAFRVVMLILITAYSFD